MKNAAVNYTTQIDGINARMGDLMKEVRKQILFDLPLTCNIHTINKIDAIANSFKSEISSASNHGCTVEESLIAQQWDSVGHWIQIRCMMDGISFASGLVNRVLIGA